MNILGDPAPKNPKLSKTPIGAAKRLPICVLLSLGSLMPGHPGYYPGCILLYPHAVNPPLRICRATDYGESVSGKTPKSKFAALARLVGKTPRRHEANFLPLDAVTTRE